MRIHVGRALVCALGFLALFLEPALGQNPAVSGQWGSVISWPFIPVSAANLPDGRILTWSGSERTTWPSTEQSYTAMWNPTTGAFVERFYPGHNMFCAHLAMTPDGDVFVNGGRNQTDSPWVSLFDAQSSQWIPLEEMATGGRWYPTTVGLGDGRIFTGLGTASVIKHPEVYDPDEGDWTILNGVDFNLLRQTHSGMTDDRRWWPLFRLGPSGEVFHFWSTAESHYIDTTGAGAARPANVTTDFTDYSQGPSVYYDKGKLLVTGSMQGTWDSASKTRAFTVDLNGAAPDIKQTSPMLFARRYHNAVVLPTGEVLVIGGNTSGQGFSDSGTVYAAELWNPTSGAWTQMASMTVPRNYHSIAILLPDGRVLAAGGGYNTTSCSCNHQDGQIYSPRYLFAAGGGAATRPQITGGPATVHLGDTFNVTTDTAVAYFSAIRMSAVTHQVNTDQAYLRVASEPLGGNQYRLTAESNPNVFMPGYWMLFAVNAAGVPSKAHIVRVDPGGTPIVQNPGVQASVEGDVISLPIVADDEDADALTYSADGLPPGLSIDPLTGVIDGAIDYGVTGSFRVTVTVTDDDGAVAAVFDWKVFPLGTYRYFRLMALSAHGGGQSVTAAEFNLVAPGGANVIRSGWSVSADSAENSPARPATDAIDGDAETYWRTEYQPSEAPLPHWFVIDAGEPVTVTAFRYLPRQSGGSSNRINSYAIYVSANGVAWGQPVAQGTFSSSSSEKTVSITLPPVNYPPVLGDPGPQSDPLGAPVSLAVSATDLDLDPLTYGASGLPPGLSIHPQTGTISGTPTVAGAYVATVSVSDGQGGADQVTFDWIVVSNPFIQPILAPPAQRNTVVQYTASVQGAVNPTFRWNFGDGTPETPASSSASITHAFAAASRYIVRVSVTDAVGGTAERTFIQAIHNPLDPLPPNVSSSVIYAPGSGRVWNVNPDNDTVSVFNATTHAKLAEIPVGQSPRALALAPDGRVWVTNKRSATLSVIDPLALAVVQTINLAQGSAPHGIVFVPGGNDAWVSLETRGEVVRLTSPAGTLLDTVPVGPWPRHVSIDGAAERLYVSRFITPRLPGEETAAPDTTQGGGEIVVVDLATHDPSMIVLAHDDTTDTEHSARGVPNYLGPTVVSPDGLTAWVPSKQDNVLRGGLRDGEPLNHENTLRGVTSKIDLGSQTEDLDWRMDHDDGGTASSGLFEAHGVYLFVALESSREIVIIDAYAGSELGRIDVGLAPQGLALRPDGKKLYVHNFLGRSVTVHDTTALIEQGLAATSLVTTYNTVAAEVLSPQVLLGKQLFYDARDSRLAADRYMACASCHNDGAQDGRVWDLTDKGEGLRNTIGLRGHAGMGHGPLHWSANFDEVQDFEGQIRGLAAGTGLMADADFHAGTRAEPLGDPKAGLSADLDALAAYVASLDTFERSPERDPDGSLNAAGELGEGLFRSQACGSCHGGVNFSDSAPGAPLHDVGTIGAASGGRLGGPLPGLDTPTLRGVSGSAPYLHDGSAATLQEAIAAHDVVALTAPERDLLAAYLRQIDDLPAGAPPCTDADGDAACDVGDPDDDNDGASDTQDCSPLGRGVSEVAGAVGPTLFMGKWAGGSDLFWSRGYQGHVTNVYRGTLTAGVPWSYSQVCLDAEQPGTTTLDSDVPPEDTAYAYLVSAVNACGESSLALSSSGGEVFAASPCPSLHRDSDDDGVLDLEDNCPLVPNSSLADADQDFIGDACE